MQEVLKKVTNDVIEPTEKSVILCLKSRCVNLSGTWSWEMQSPAVYCSDVMSFPDDFIGTKGIIHPDDLPNVNAALSMMEDKDLACFDFRIITTYGEVKAISGQRVSIEEDKPELTEPVPGKEAWQEIFQQLAAQKENNFLQLRKELMEYTERVHGIGSWLINKQTGQAWYSDNVFRIYGLAPQSLNAHANTFNSFIHKNDRIPVTDAFEKAYADQTPLHIEYRIVLADGATKYVQQITKWFYAVNGQEILGGIFRDVSEERAIVDELVAAQSSSLLHQHILKISEQQCATGFWFMNLVTRKASYSDHYYRIYGLKQTVLPEYNSFLNLVHADDRPRVRGLIDKMLNEHVLPEAEFRIVRPDGKLRYLKQSGKVFISQNKELIMIGLVQDISVQKGLEKKILELNESIELNKIVAEMSENAGEITSFVWLPDGYMQWSDGFYRFLGYKPGGIEPLPRFLYKNIHPADLKVFRDAETLLLNQQNHDDIVIRFISRGGIKQARIFFRQVNYGKDVIVALVQDISKQTEAHYQFVHNKLYAELLTDSVTDMIIFTNVDHTITHWNAIAEEKTGIRKEEALYHNIFDVLPQLNDPDFLGQLLLSVKGNEFHITRAHNYYLRKPHDYRLWPLKNETGEVLGVLHVVHDISRQMELQQQLSERLNFIESLVEFSVDRIVVLDRFMNYLYWNKKAEEYYVINKERVLGKNILEVFPSFRNHPNYQQFRSVLKGETVYLPPVADKETDEYFETYLIPIKDENNDVTAVLWIVHDLSREWQLTKERTKTANLLQATMDASNEMIQVFEAVRNEEGEIIDFRYLILNHEAEKWMPGAIGKSLLELQPGVVEEGIFDTFKRVVETGIPDQSERHYVHEQFDGWFFQSVVKLNDGVATTTRDITARKKAEQELKESKDLVQTVFDVSVNPIAYHKALRDASGKIVDFEFQLENQEARKYAIEDRTGKKYSEAYPGIRDTVVFQLYCDVVETGKELNTEVQLNLKGTNRWFHLMGVKLDDGLVATALDITERKIAEKEILRLKDEVAQKATDRYYSIFNSIDEGFCIQELIYDDNGRPVDARAVEVNPAYEKQTGLKDVVGKLNSELSLAAENYWLKKYDYVVKTGESLRFENWHESSSRWYHVFLSRIGGEDSRQLAVVFSDITERKRREEQQAFLSEISKDLVELKDINDAIKLLGEKVAKLFHAPWCNFAEMTKGVVTSGWNPDAVSSIEGHKMRDLWTEEQILKNNAGELTIVNDTENDPRVNAENYAALNMRSFIIVPLAREGEFRFMLAIADNKAREWRDDEIELVKELTTRIWARLEKARVEEALRKNEERMRFLKEAYQSVVDGAELATSLHILTHLAINETSGDARIAFYIINEHGTQLHTIRGAGNMPDAYAGEIDGFAIGTDSPDCGRAGLTGQPVITPDVYEELLWKPWVFIAEKYDYRGCWSFPIKTKDDKAIGTFAMYFRTRREATAKDIELAGLVTQAAAVIISSDTQGRKRVAAEEALKTSEQRLKGFNTSLEQEVKERTQEIQNQFTLLQFTEQLAQSGSWEYDIATGNFTWSEGMYNLFGLPLQAKIRPKIYLDHAVEEDRSIAKRIIDNLTKKHEAFEEIIKIQKGKESRLLKIKSSVITDENGKREKIVGVDLDITDIQKVKEDLRERERWLEQMAKASPDSITIYDLQKKQPFYLNNCLAEWTGVEASKLVEMGVEGRLQLIHPDDRLKLLQFHEKVAAAFNGDVFTMEYRIIDKQGRLIWLRNRCKVFQRDASGKVTYLLSIVQNVTEEIELREELKQRTRFAEAILDVSVDRITVFDRNYQFVGWNKRCEQIHHKTREEVMGKTIFEMFPGVESHPEFIDAQERSLKGEFVHVPMIRDSYTGDYLELFYIPLKNENDETYAVVNIMHDVSDYVMTTEALNLMNKKLESKNIELEQKNDEITSFAFVASHDMKEPLRKIHTFSDWLMEQETGQLSPKGKSLVEKINASVYRMEILIDDILVLTKIHSDPHKEEDVDLNKTLKWVFDDMLEQISQTQTGIHSEELPVIKGNSNQVYYLFKNLINNAIKFQKPGNVPEIKISSEIVNGNGLRIPQPQDEYVKISFADNGFGFDQRYSKKIFQVFQRLHGKHEFEGTGIGLAICKKIMENHGGIIDVVSELGKGSVFSCYFPLH